MVEDEMSILEPDLRLANGMTPSFENLSPIISKMGHREWGGNIMSTFVRGTIVEQEGFYADYYEMKLRVPTGHVLPLNYDNTRHTSKPPDNEEEETANDPMSDLLEVGGTYELLTVMELQRLTFQPSVPPGTIFKVETKVIERTSFTIKRDEIRQGKVLDLSWNVASQEYLAISLHATIYQKRYVLLETAIGKLLINYRDIQLYLGEQGEQVTAGSYLQWQNSTLVLLAIIEKDAPKPEV